MIFDGEILLERHQTSYVHIGAIVPELIAVGKGRYKLGYEPLPPAILAQAAGGETMTISLPAPLKAAVDAINAADTDAFVAAFAPTGLVNDWGRVLNGHDGVRSWAQSDAIGAGAQMTVTEATTTGDVTHIVFDWKSRVFNGRSQAYVTVKDGLITEFRIPSH